MNVVQLRREPDVIVSSEGTTVYFRTVSDAADDWVTENLALGPEQWIGDRFAFDHDSAQAVIDVLHDEGFRLEIT